LTRQCELRQYDLIRVRFNIEKYKSYRFDSYGVIVRHYDVPRRAKIFAVNFPGMRNKRSNDGLFWFTEEQLEFIQHFTVQQAHDFINQKESNERKEENNMNQNYPGERCSCEATTTKQYNNVSIVNLYFERKLEALMKENNKNIEAARLEDLNINSIRTAMSAALINAADQDSAQFTFENFSLCNFQTSVTMDKVKEIEADYEAKAAEIRTKSSEVKIMLSACGTYADEINILIGYGIVERTEAGGIVMK